MIWLLSALGWIKRATDAILAAALSHPREAVILALLALCAFLAWQSDNKSRTIASERAAHAAQIENYRKAGEQSLAFARAEKLRKETRYAEASKQSQAAYDALAARYRAAVLRAAQAHPGSAAKANMPVLAANTGVPETAGSSAIVPFLIDTADALICADNTAKAQAARDYLLTLEQIK